MLYSKYTYLYWSGSNRTGAEAETHIEKRYRLNTTTAFWKYVCISQGSNDSEMARCGV